MIRSFRFGDCYRISELCVLVNFGDLCKMRLLKNIEKLSPSYDKCNLIQIMVRYKHQELIGGWRKEGRGYHDPSKNHLPTITIEAWPKTQKLKNHCVLAVFKDVTISTIVCFVQNDYNSLHKCCDRVGKFMFTDFC